MSDPSLANHRPPNHDRVLPESIAARTQSQARTFATVCLCVGILWLAVTMLFEKEPSAESSTSIATTPIDINQADWMTFSQLDGIGPTMAFRIVADREHFGRFESVDDIQRVEGIGPLTLDRIRSRLTIGHDQLKHTEEHSHPTE